MGLSMSNATFFFLILLLVVSMPAAPSEDVGTWREPEKSSLLIMNLDSGRVVIELAPQFAPKHVANIKRLTEEGYFNETVILRSHDNYVVQWGKAEVEAQLDSTQESTEAKLDLELFRDIHDVNFQEIESRDAYAEKVGFVDGFPAASNGRQVWLAHCYGMVGVSRGMAPNSGDGSGLYVVTGHAPRHLDRNITVVGRVLEGMPLLSSLPRGTANLGFFDSPQQYIPIREFKQASDSDAESIQVMDTNSKAFKSHVAARTSRRHEWFIEPTNKIELCNVGIPSR